YSGGNPTNQRTTQFSMTPHLSVGRPQPYAGGNAPILQVQSTTPPPANGEVQHTFFRHNSESASPPTTSSARLTVPFDWMVHLDRNLISPLELVHVSAVSPCLLTQKFIGGSGLLPTDKQQHTAPWVVANISTGQPAPNATRTATVVQQA